MRKLRGYKSHDGNLSLMVTPYFDGGVIPFPEQEFAISEFVDYSTGSVTIPYDMNRGDISTIDLLLPTESQTGSSSWKDLKFDIKVRLDEQIKDLLPIDEKVVPNFSVTVSCRMKRYALKSRQTIKLLPTSDMEYSGSITFQNTEIIGSIEMEAMVNRSSDASEPKKYDIARKKHAILATSPRIKYHRDIKLSSSGGLVDFRWRDFTSSDAYKKYSSELIVMDFGDPGKIICYLNKRCTKWYSIVESTQGGKREKMRKSMSASIISHVYQNSLLYSLFENSTKTSYEIMDDPSWQGIIIMDFGKSMNYADHELYISNILEEVRKNNIDKILIEVSTWAQRRSNLVKTGENLTDILMG